MDYFPDEILRHIFQFVETITQIRIRRVCKRWHWILGSFPLIYSITCGEEFSSLHRAMSNSIKEWLPNIFVRPERVKTAAAFRLLSHAIRLSQYDGGFRKVIKRLTIVQTAGYTFAVSVWDIISHVVVLCRARKLWIEQIVLDGVPINCTWLEDHYYFRRHYISLRNVRLAWCPNDTRRENWVIDEEAMLIMENVCAEISSDLERVLAGNSLEGESDEFVSIESKRRRREKSDQHVLLMRIAEEHCPLLTDAEVAILDHHKRTCPQNYEYHLRCISEWYEPMALEPLPRIIQKCLAVQLLKKLR